MDKVAALNSRFDDLADAITRRDVDAANKAIDGIATIAGQDTAQQVVDGLVRKGFERLTTSH